MVRVEPLGLSGNEQAFRVTEESNEDIVVYDLGKGRVVTCSFCKYDCKHARHIETYLEYMNDNPNYMGLIKWAWFSDDGNFPYNFRIRYFAVWDWLSNGLMRQRNRTFEETEKMVHIVNYHLDRMSDLAISLLTLWCLPEYLEDMSITTRWEAARVEAIENGLYNYDWPT